jgi:glucosamine-6-phosphate deaminase
VVIIASSYKKARALQKIVEEGVNHMWTASVLQLHPKAIVVCDEEAVVELKVATVNYFRDIESHNLEPCRI